MADKQQQQSIGPRLDFLQLQRVALALVRTAAANRSDKFIENRCSNREPVGDRFPLVLVLRRCEARDNSTGLRHRVLHRRIAGKLSLRDPPVLKGTASGCRLGLLSAKRDWALIFLPMRCCGPTARAVRLWLCCSFSSLSECIDWIRPDQRSATDLFLGHRSCSGCVCLEAAVSTQYHLYGHDRREVQVAGKSCLRPKRMPAPRFRIILTAWRQVLEIVDGR